MAENAGPWKCFHCGFSTSDPAEAADHFDTVAEPLHEDDVPVCVTWEKLRASDQREMQEIGRLRRVNRAMTEAINEIDCALRDPDHYASVLQTVRRPLLATATDCIARQTDGDQEAEAFASISLRLTALLWPTDEVRATPPTRKTGLGSCVSHKWRVWRHKIRRLRRLRYEALQSQAAAAARAKHGA